MSDNSGSRQVPLTLLSLGATISHLIENLKLKPFVLMISDSPDDKPVRVRHIKDDGTGPVDIKVLRSSIMKPGEWCVVAESGEMVYPKEAE